MMEMAAMMGAQQGASIANEATNELFQNMCAALQENQSNAQNSLQQFSAQASKAESDQAKILEKIFIASIKHVTAEEKNISAYTKQMQDYIFKAISLHKQPLYYLISPSVAMILDQGFTNGTMYTPNGPTWKNIFQYGDWEYDYVSDSFYQYNKVPVFTTTTDPRTDTPIQSSSQAAYNSIFTEYFTYARSYEIQCEITLYDIQYPFFVGMQFNKTRWISGNADSITKSRLLGIYGSSARNIGIYYTEQKILPSSPKGKSASISDFTTLYPLEQIVQKKTQQQAALSSNLFNNIYQQPTTFIIRVITSPQTIEYKIWPQNTPEPQSFTTINNIQKDLYLYHGIGFMSPGAIAQFKLVKPTNLLFSQQARTDFAQEVKALLSQQ